MGRGRVPGVPAGPPRRRTARGAAAAPTVLPGPRAARHREGPRGPRRAWGRGDARRRRERPAPRPGDRAGASLGPPARDARRRAGASRHERRLPARALGRVVGVPSAPGASGGRHAGGRVAPAGAARTDGRRRRGGSCAQGPRRAVLARPGRGDRAGPARGRSEPADELRAEPRKLGGRSSGRARVGARGVGFTADRRARGAGRRSRGGGGPVPGSPRCGARGARSRRICPPRPQPPRLRPDPGLRRLRGRAPLRALSAGASLPPRDARARVPAVRSEDPGGQPLRPLSWTAAPAARLGNGATGGRGAADVPRGPGDSL